MTEIACPICHAGPLARGEGKLDQSGDSYLPTVVWSCGCCGYAHFEPALGRKWRAGEEEAAAGAAPRAIGSTAPSGAPRARPAPAAAARSRRAA